MAWREALADDLLIAAVIPVSALACTVVDGLAAGADGLAGEADVWAESAPAVSEAASTVEARARERNMDPPSGVRRSPVMEERGDVLRKGNPHASGRTRERAWRA